MRTSRPHGDVPTDPDHVDVSAGCAHRPWRRMGAYTLAPAASARQWVREADDEGHGGEDTDVGEQWVSGSAELR
jgi:hypothetical protein